MAWPTLVDKIIQYQEHEQLCRARLLSAHDIVSCIMRKENYLIGMLNKGVLRIDLPSWMQGVSPLFTYGKKKQIIMTKLIEWSLVLCIFEPKYDK